MRQVYSEYLLYEPILRILTAYGCNVSCEYACEGLGERVQGDKRRIDFKVTQNDWDFAMEVKWAKKCQINIKGDYEKLMWFTQKYPKSDAYLCVFGRHKHLESLNLPRVSFREAGSARYADVTQTHYGCRIFKLKAKSSH